MRRYSNSISFLIIIIIYFTNLIYFTCIVVKKEAIERNNKLEKELLKEKEKCDNQMKVLSKQLNSSQSTNRDKEEQLKEMMKKMESKV